MKVTFILRDLSDAFYNGSPTFGPGLLQQDPSQQFERLNRLVVSGAATVKIGNGSFRDRVELNQIRRNMKPPTFTLEPRRGYKLATFEFK